MAANVAKVGVEVTGAAKAARELDKVADSYKRIGDRLRDSRGRFVKAGEDVDRLGDKLRNNERSVSRFGRAWSSMGGALKTVRGWWSKTGDMVEKVTGKIGKGFGALGSILKPFGILGAIGSVVATVGVIGNILPSLALLPAFGAAAAGGLTAMMLGFKGVGEALEAGLTGDTEAYNAALKKLAPSAREVTKALVGMQKPWQKIAQTTQQALFKGVGPNLTKTEKAVRPGVAKALPAISGAIGGAINGVLELLRKPESLTMINRILANVASFFDGAARAAAPFTQALLDLAAAGSELLGGAGRGLAGLAQSFADWIREAKNSGKLQEFLDKAVRNLGMLVQIGADVGRMFKAIFKGAGDESDGFLASLQKITDKLADWMESDDGQDQIKAWVKMGEALAAAVLLLVEWNAAFSDWITAALKFAGSVVQAIFAGFGLILQGAVKAFGWIPGLGPKLKEAEAQFAAFRDRVNDALNGIKDQTVNINLKTFGAGTHANEQFNVRIGRRASGGTMLPGGAYLTGEGHRELVQMPGGGGPGRVFNSTETSRMLAGGGGGPMQVEIGVAQSSTGPVADLFRYLLRVGALQLRVANGKVVAV